MTDQTTPIEIVDGTLTAFGDLRTAELSPVFQGSFEYTVDNTELTSTAVVNGGTVTQAEAMAVCTTSTTTASTAKLASKQHARYRAGLGGLLRFTALYTTGVAATEQYVGLMGEAGSSESFNNGYAIGMNGTTFSVLRWQNDVLISVPQSSFNKDKLDGTGPSGITIDVTKLNVFAINYQYLGAGDIDFLIEDPSTGKLFVFHKIEYANANTSPSVHNPNFCFVMWANNKATTSNLIVKSSSYAYFTEGKANGLFLQQPQFSSGAVQKNSVISEVALFTIRNKSTYQSKTNFIDFFLQHFTASIEANSTNNLGQIRIVKNTTLGGSPSYSDINTSDSVVDIDTAGTTLTGGKELLSVQLAGKNDRVFQEIDTLKIILGPGETMTVSGSSVNQAIMRAAILWKELF